MNPLIPLSPLTPSTVVKAITFVGVLTLTGCSSTPTPQCTQSLDDDDSKGNAGCLIVRDAALVMVQQTLSGAWSVPGGSAEKGESAVCTAARETYEETGLKVRVVKKLLVLNNNFHLYHCVEEDLTLNQTPYKNALAPADATEIRAAAWQSPQQRQQLEWRYPAQKELINQLADQLNDTR